MSIETALDAGDRGTVAKVQILATEHWSLLATRSLTYTESLGRVTIFLAILSGAVIALALVGQADDFGLTFIWIAVPLLSVVVFVGVSTIARLHALNRDDYRWVIGMNRLRHAYLELYPELEPYFTASPQDDLHGALQTLGVDDIPDGRAVGSPLHLIQTLPGMLSVIVAAVAGAIGGLAAVALAIQPAGAVLAAAAAFILLIVSLGRLGQRAVGHPTPSLQPRFPTPGGQVAPR